MFRKKYLLTLVFLLTLLGLTSWVNFKYSRYVDPKIDTIKGSLTFNTPNDIPQDFRSNSTTTNEFRLETYLWEEYEAPIPNDPSFIHGQPVLQRLNMPEAWLIEKGDPSILVSVIDSGINYSHPEFQECYLDNGYDWVNDDSDPMDDFGHGTHVAGIIAAETNNNLGIAGMASVKIMVEKVIDSENNFFTLHLAQAINHSVDQGAEIISMSLAYNVTEDPLVINAIEYAADNGVILVSAAGNWNSSDPHWPAANTEVISVAATNVDDSRWPKSNFGSWIDISAPGADNPGIYSTLHDEPYYGLKNGTSMAAPHVTGLIALMLSRNSSLLSNEIKQILTDSAIDLGTLGFDNYYGYGLIDPVAALMQVPSPPVFGYTTHELEYIEGESNQYITWVGVDVDPSTYLISFDGDILDFNIWNNKQVLNLSVDGLSAGVHLFSCKIVDNQGNEATNVIRVIVSPPDVVQHVPIDISGNDDFLSQATAEGWSGDGTIDNPIIIEQLNITASDVDLINIVNTDLHFIIRNCVLKAGIDGVYFYTVKNGLVQDNLILGNTYGIHLLNSESNVISANKIHNSTQMGIYCDSSDYSNITFNQLTFSTHHGLFIEDCSFVDVIGNQFLYNHQAGLYLEIHKHCHNIRISYNSFIGSRVGISFYSFPVANECYHVNISHNLIDNNDYSGIYLDLSGDDYTIDHNIITNNGYYGIYMFYLSFYSTIAANHIQNHRDGIWMRYFYDGALFGNNITSNTRYGIFLEHCYDIKIGGNTITMNGDYGMYFDYDTDRCFVEMNHFIDNNLDYPTGRSQVRDNNPDKLFSNHFEMNYWSDWPSDIFPPIPYSINGSADSEDEFPLRNPYIFTRHPEFHFLVGGEILFGNIILSWSSSESQWSLPHRYSIFYSSDGYHWIPIITNTESSIFELNTTIIADGSYYLKLDAIPITDYIPLAWFEHVLLSPIIIQTHEFTPPVILSPENGEIISESFTIQWSPCTDSIGHDFNYSIHYSSDQIYWYEIVSNITNTGFYWDITTIPDGDYSLRICVICTSGYSIFSGILSFTIYTPIEPTLTTPQPSSGMISPIESTTTQKTHLETNSSEKPQAGSFPSITLVMLSFVILVACIKKR